MSSVSSARLFSSSAGWTAETQDQDLAANVLYSGYQCDSLPVGTYGYSPTSTDWTSKQILQDWVTQLESAIAEQRLDEAIIMAEDGLERQEVVDEFGDHIIVMMAYCKLFSDGLVIKMDTFAALSNLETITWEEIEALPLFYQELVGKVQEELEKRDLLIDI